ncbi:alpha/beta hydrolase [Ktedonobacter racemifer]|uniref:Putative esterase n=1 Tax=Ktedonobacter racemifer DSM 44963 TaxID=485913 RepID=D6TJZ0_KTERA|nr:alpha/beta hydrolase-fold protein [Ktedonobacter racemifer]EFH89747.1 putative esterase [Ktedonobacter racemifer DSM 44963]
MNKLQPRLRKLFKRIELLQLLRYTASLIAALLSGLFLFTNATLGTIASSIIDVGLDPLRSQLIAALIMTALVALIGALIGRRKAATILGAALVFCLGYLKGFINLERQPVYDPGGHLEPLQANALFNTSLIMLALALLSAFIGSAVGVATGESVIDPPLHTLQRGFMLLWRRWEVRRLRQRGAFDIDEAATQPGLFARTNLGRSLSQWAGAIAIILILVFALRSGDLFIFSPDVGLHAAPHITASKSGDKNAEKSIGVSSIKQDYVKSKALGATKPFEVYLPPSYNTPQGKIKHYPVLYLLHGSPGKDIDWLTGGKAGQSTDTLITTGKIPELILVMPDGNGKPGRTSEWGDSYNKKQPIEKYITTDLVDYVDQHYRTIPDPSQRAIGGLSMGGFGAANIAIHHPDIFGTFISLGGYYYAEGSVWGSDPTYRLDNSPAYTILSTPRARKLHIYLGAATKDQPYYNDTLGFMKQLDKLKIPYHFDLQKGYHSWGIWATQMYNALGWLKWD